MVSCSNATQLMLKNKAPLKCLQILILLELFFLNAEGGNIF